MGAANATLAAGRNSSHNLAQLIRGKTSLFATACDVVSERIKNNIFLNNQRFPAIYCGELQFIQKFGLFLFLKPTKSSVKRK